MSAAELGSRVRAARRRLRWDLRHFSYQTGIDPANLSRIEHGRRDVRVRTLRVIAGALGVTCGELLD